MRRRCTEVYFVSKAALTASSAAVAGSLPRPVNDGFELPTQWPLRNQSAKREFGSSGRFVRVDAS
jgi:hypothetical protein